MERCLSSRILVVIGMIVLMVTPTSASAQQARITKLTDVAFGTIANFVTDLSNAQSICVYSTGTSSRYHVTATGSGAGGAFTLASGSNLLAYEVQWNASPNQTTGNALNAGIALTGLTSTATASACGSGPSTSASLIMIIRTGALSAATAGVYSGTLTLLIAPN